MKEVTIADISVEQMKKLLEAFPEATAKNKSTWTMPVGEGKVTLTVEGPAYRRESELLQYAIDVLEVAKKHATD